MMAVFLLIYTPYAFPVTGKAYEQKKVNMNRKSGRVSFVRLNLAKI